MGTFTPEGLVVGKRYRIHHQTNSQRNLRESVLIYLGVDEYNQSTSTIWSARPVAGTQELDHSQIKAIWLVDDNTPIQINSKVDARKG